MVIVVTVAVLMVVAAGVRGETGNGSSSAGNGNRGHSDGRDGSSGGGSRQREGRAWGEVRE